MDKSEPYNLLAQKLAGFLDHARLARLVEAGSVERFVVRGESGTMYLVEVRSYWENKERGQIQVIGSIDDGGKPLVQTLKWSLPGAVANKAGAMNSQPADPPTRMPP